jgi:hypothetical protein
MAHGTNGTGKEEELLIPASKGKDNKIFRSVI